LNFYSTATGDWSCVFSLHLCITPFRKLFKLPDLIRFRRMLGFSLFLRLPALSHLSRPDQSFDLSGMLEDVAKRPLFTVGFLGSFINSSGDHFHGGLDSASRRKRWQQLHRAIYVTAVCGVIHYYWLVKSDVRKPLFYGALVGILLFVEDWAIGFFKRRKQAPVRPHRPCVSCETAENLLSARCRWNSIPRSAAPA